MDISGVLLRNMPDQVSNEIQTKLLPHYAKMMMNVNTKQDYELIEGTCFLIDCLEFGNEELLNVCYG